MLEKLIKVRLVVYSWDVCEYSPVLFWVVEAYICVSLELWILCLVRQDIVWELEVEIVYIGNGVMVRVDFLKRTWFVR